MSQSWILMVEDDPIFSLLFCRAWAGSYGRVPIRVAGSLAAMRALLQQATEPPLLIILDRSLPDGNGHQVAVELRMATYCWSSLGEGTPHAKPERAAALQEAVDKMASLAGLLSAD